MTTGSLRNASYRGDYWSAVAYGSGLAAYHLAFNGTNVYSADNNVGRWGGFAVGVAK